MIGTENYEQQEQVSHCATPEEGVHMTVDELFLSHGVKKKTVAELMKMRKACSTGEHGKNVIILYHIRLRDLKLRNTFSPRFLIKTEYCHACGNIHKSTCIETGRWIVINENNAQIDSCNSGNIARADALEIFCTEYDHYAFLCSKAY